MDYSKLDQEKRDQLLKNGLPSEKVKIIEKFGLHSTKELYWASVKENAHDHIIFKHSFLEKNDIMHILFRINRLCFAKVNHYSLNADKYEPQVYDFRKGFIKTEWWNTEFLKHKESGTLIDLRFLQTITDIQEFKSICTSIENPVGTKKSSN